MKLTKEQKYQRRLARKYGLGAIQHGSEVIGYYGKFSVYWYARTAAWHAFRAHPELRGE